VSAKVVILLGSASDWPVMQSAAAELEALGVPWSAHVTSAHRTPERTSTIVRETEAAGAAVFICGAGMAAHLAGAVAAQTIRPVIGVPLAGGIADGLDALLSTVQMPGGIPVATVAVGKAGAKNAAILAAQMLALEDFALAERLAAVRAAKAREIAATELSGPGGGA
jgi:5-(carboxyamino)imidazole ribonucleotide mutase